MRFAADKPIFQQIVDQLEDRIIQGEILPEARIPAVRDYAVELEVNPNTVVRSFLELEQSGVIFKKRGLGYFLAPDAKGIVLARRKQEFLQKELPEMMRKLHLLGIEFEVVAQVFKEVNSAVRRTVQPIKFKDSL